MSEKKGMKGAATTGLVAAIAASSCCIPPVIAAIAGVGGISSSMSWMEPLRPYLIGFAVLAIGYAWYVHLKPKKVDDCGCEIDNPSFFQTRGFLIGMTLFAALALTFPYYSGIFFNSIESERAGFVDEANVDHAVLSIDGMTCTGCEHHVEQSLISNPGVLSVDADFESNSAFVEYDNTSTSLDEIVAEVESGSGYDVISSELNPITTHEK